MTNDKHGIWAGRTAIVQTQAMTAKKINCSQRFNILSQLDLNFFFKSGFFIKDSIQITDLTSS